ncbi:MAG: alpha/beta hydrolase [Chitinophagaceae bacterium]|nr:alpha/beta hydrolase [Chitinophagaceae bacterium]MBK8953782.1 alpha/beta hydrolase [Chitinophagaceae bacterium]
MTEHHVSYGQSVLAYKIFGKGPELVLCFHGYGESAIAFSFLEKHAGDRFTFIAFDLPHHGATKWNDKQNFDPEDLEKIVIHLLNIPSLFPNHQSSITVLGFSLGGRMALSLYQSMPEKVKKMVLLAPDGLKVNFWYWLATQIWLGNKLFAVTMKHPAWFFTMLKLFNKLKLVNASIFKFVRFYIGDKEARSLLFKRWTSLRHIKPYLPVIKKAIDKNKTATILFYGKHDRIIRSSVGEKFSRGIENNCIVEIIASGHQVLHEKHAAAIAAALTQK